MSIYRVISASIYRDCGLLRVECEQLDANGSSTFEIEGVSGRFVQMRHKRFTFNEKHEINGQVWVIDPPDFPIADLEGRRLSNLVK